MRTSKAVVGSAVFFVAAPGTVVGFVPWLITRWEVTGNGPWWPLFQAVGVVLIVAGIVPAVHAFVQFAKAGGTPAPVAPTEHLVVTGPNRYVRNPMYIGLLGAIVGQALLFGSVGLLIYAAIGWAATASFVRFYEEPTLRRQFGHEYDTYKQNVPAWVPRVRPWSPGDEP